MDKREQMKEETRKLGKDEWAAYMHKQAMLRAAELNEQEKKKGIDRFDALKYAASFAFCTPRERYHIRRCCEEAWEWGKAHNFIPPTYANNLRRAIWLSTLS